MFFAELGAISLRTLRLKKPGFTQRPQRSKRKGRQGEPSAIHHHYCHLSSVNCQLSTVNCHLSSVNCQLSTVNCHLSTVICQLSTVNSYLAFTKLCRLLW